MAKTYEIVTLYEAYDTDGEGFGRNIAPIGFFTSQAAALEARGNNPYTGMSERQAIKVEEEYFLLYDPDPVDVNNQRATRANLLRKNALAKLSAEERAALGIKG